MRSIKRNIPKILILAIFIMVSAGFAKAQFIERFPENFKKLSYIEGDFGDYVWGVPMEAVKEIEYKKLTPLIQEVENALFYQIKYRGKKSIVSYEFEDNKLVRGQIDIYEQNPDAQKWFDLLLEEQIDLEKEFGEPAREEFVWTNRSRINFPEEWRFALLEGQMAAYLGFLKERTTVNVTLKQKERFKIGMTIAYEKADRQKPTPVAPEVEPLNLPSLNLQTEASTSGDDQTSGTTDDLGSDEAISDILLP